MLFLLLLPPPVSVLLEPVVMGLAMERDPEAIITVGHAVKTLAIFFRLLQRWTPPLWAH